MFFKTVKPEELLGKGVVRKLQYLHRLISLRLHLKRINMFFLTKISW